MPKMVVSLLHLASSNFRELCMRKNLHRESRAVLPQILVAIVQQSSANRKQKNEMMFALLTGAFGSSVWNPTKPV